MEEDKSRIIKEKLARIRANNLMREIEDEVKKMNVDVNKSLEEFAFKVEDSLNNDIESSSEKSL